MLREILNRNYKNHTQEEIKESANKAIELIEKGFRQVNNRIVPFHIQQEIDELKEALAA